MRIAFWTNLQQVHSRRWASAMAARGHDVSVLTPHPAPDVDVAQFPLPAILRARPAVRLRITVACDHLRAPVWAANTKADLFHVHNFLPTVLGFWSFRLPQPLVVSSWGSDAAWYGRGPMPRRRAAVLRFLFKRATVVTITSEHQRGIVGPFLPSGTEPVVIPWGVDTARFRPGPHPVGSRAPVVVYPKGFRRHYAPDVLLRAVPRVRARVPEVRFRLLGAGPLEAEARELAKDLGVADCVEFRGAIPPADMPRQWDDAAVGVVCSRWETFGVACLEAQAAGVPVVISDIPGLGETGGPGSGTVAVRPEDPDALADALVRLLRDAGERERLGEQGRRHVSQRFTWSRTVDAMEAVYARAVGAVGPSP